MLNLKDSAASIYNSPEIFYRIAVKARGNCDQKNSIGILCRLFRFGAFRREFDRGKQKGRRLDQGKISQRIGIIPDVECSSADDPALDRQ